MKRRSVLTLAAASALAGLGGCAGVPTMPPATVDVPAAYKEAPPGWQVAQPADGLARGAWWRAFNDPALDALAEQLQQSNLDIAASVAALAQARALVREQRAGYFPTLGLQGSATRSGGSGGSGSGGSGSGSSDGTRLQLSLAASWEPDLWGRVRGNVTAAGARAQASEADLENVRLSSLAELATDVLALRADDAELTLLRDTIAGYERVLQIAQNRYAAGIAPKSDVLQAQTQLANARADVVQLERDRATLEHAIGVLVGQAPANFALPVAAWNPDTVPEVPAALPSALLQRRPDVAAAQRRMVAANADIGVARTAFFPSLSLSGSAGSSATRLADLGSSTAWSLGLSLAQALFDGGANRARVEAARAAWEQSLAQYRLSALSAFRDVEDQLLSARTLQQQQALRREASAAADQTEAQVMNRYRAGQVSFSEVVAAAVSALSARRAVVQVAASRQQTAVSLVRALGGGWPGLAVADAGAAPATTGPAQSATPAAGTAQP